MGRPMALTEPTRTSQGCPRDPQGAPQDTSNTKNELSFSLGRRRVGAPGGPRETAPDAPKTPQDAPKTPQRRPKDAPRRPEAAPRRSKDAPRRPKGTPKTKNEHSCFYYKSLVKLTFSPLGPAGGCPGVPKTALWMLTGPPRCAQGRPRGAPETPRGRPRTPKEPPRDPQGPRLATRRSPRAPQGHPRG